MFCAVLFSPIWAAEWRMAEDSTNIKDTYKIPAKL